MAHELGVFPKNRVSADLAGKRATVGVGITGSQCCLGSDLKQENAADALQPADHLGKHHSSETHPVTARQHHDAIGSLCFGLRELLRASVTGQKRCLGGEIACLRHYKGYSSASTEWWRKHAKSRYPTETCRYTPVTSLLYKATICPYGHSRLTDSKLLTDAIVEAP